MENNVKGKNIVITGATGGIGRIIALTLAKEGANIVLFGGRDKEKLESLKKEIKAFKVKCLAIGGNLSSIKGLDAKINKTIKVFNNIDVLINNAGTAQNTPFLSVTEKEYDEIFSLNVKVPYFLTQKLLPFLKKSTSPTVINVASVVGHLGYANQSTYTASKHALIGFSKAFATELFNQNVRCHVISPGGVMTDMIKLTRPDLAGEKMIEPKDIADVIVFLLNFKTDAVIDEIKIHRSGKEPFLV